MHGFIEVDMGDKPALRPKAPIAPALRAIAAAILAHARTAIGDPERASEDTVHEFRRAMKQWRALMRLLDPFLADAARWRTEARDHARSLGTARDGQSALNAFDEDLNLRPSGYEPDELPGCSTPRQPMIFRTFI